MSNIGNIIFIGGMMRSGTSLVRTALGSHPELAVHENDLQLWTLIYPRYAAQWGKISNEQLTKIIVDAILANYKFEHLQHQATRGEVLAETKAASTADATSYRDLCAGIFASYLEAYRKLRGRPRIGHKTPESEFFADDILESFPNARFIHIYRNLPAVAASFKKKNWIEPNFRHGMEELAILWSRSISIAWRNIDRHAGRYFVLNYDKFVCSPREYLQILCAFLELPYSEEMLHLQGHIPKALARSSSFGIDGSKAIDPEIAHKPITNLEQHEIGLLHSASQAYFNTVRRQCHDFEPDLLQKRMLARILESPSMASAPGLIRAVGHVLKPVRKQLVFQRA